MSVSPDDSPPVYTEVVPVELTLLPSFPAENPPVPVTGPSLPHVPTRPLVTDTTRLLPPHDDLAKQRPSLVSLGKSSRGLKRGNVDMFDDLAGDDDGRSRLTSNLSHMSAAQCRICFSGKQNSTSGDVMRSKQYRNIQFIFNINKLKCYTVMGRYYFF